VTHPDKWGLLIHYVACLVLSLGALIGAYV